MAPYASTADHDHAWLALGTDWRSVLLVCTICGEQQLQMRAEPPGKPGRATPPSAPPTP